MSSTEELTSPKRPLPQCWAVCGASAASPVYTLANYEQALRDGVEGLECEVQMTRDNVLVLYDNLTSSLQGPTTGTGVVADHHWYGPGGLEHVRTTQEPQRPLATFPEIVALLVKPEHQHVTLLVNLKATPRVSELFEHLRAALAAHGGPEWEDQLAPRIVLGFWSPLDIRYAKATLPRCPRAYVGWGTMIGEMSFWDECTTFAIDYPVLVYEGSRFVDKCHAAGKTVVAWGVKEPAQMVECVRLEVDAILTERTGEWLELRKRLGDDYEAAMAQYEPMRPKIPWYYRPMKLAL